MYSMIPLETIAFRAFALTMRHIRSILINNSMSFARQIFTLFHELYHLISDTSGAEIIRDDFYVALEPDQEQSERACDIFANTFLIPHDDFVAELAKQPSDRGIYRESGEVVLCKPRGNHVHPA